MPPRLTALRTRTQLRAAVTALRVRNRRIALVPTMGALHAGHIALAGLAAEHADDVCVSLFVNPTQFAPGEDLDRYPRDEDGDRSKLEAAGVTLLWAPDAEEMYPRGFSTHVAMTGPACGLETDFRPHFFQGVATVVTKLLLQVLPDVAIFGEKDYQQLQVIRRLVRDLDIPVEIIGGATVREPDGLALSSRNAYLSPAERQRAPALNRTLRDAGLAALGGTEPADAEKTAVSALEAAGFGPVDYVAIRHADTLAAVTAADIAAGVPLRVLGAARLGGTRLIDNLDPRA